jgi:hypothetical protein
LLYGGKLLINPELLAEDPFSFDEYGEDSLIPFFERLLKDEMRLNWEPLEPEIRIEAEFSPKVGLKLAESNLAIIQLSARYREELRRVDEDREKAGGRLPDDDFEFLFLINELKLKPSSEERPGVYGSFVPAMRMSVSRKDLGVFVLDLKKEYEAWKIKNNEEIKHYGDKDKLPD